MLTPHNSACQYAESGYFVEGEAAGAGCAAGGTAGGLANSAGADAAAAPIGRFGVATRKTKIARCRTGASAFFSSDDKWPATIWSARASFRRASSPEATFATALESDADGAVGIASSP